MPLTFRLADIIPFMRIREFVFLLAISSVAAFAADTYQFGRIVEIIAPKLDVGDSDPMFCDMSIASPGVTYTFTIEGRQMKDCDRRFWLQQGVWFRIVDQRIFIKQPTGLNDLDGGLAGRRFEVVSYPSIDTISALGKR